MRTPVPRFEHYEILSRLGAGGMGEVFLATDTRLGRKVALKILGAGLSSDEEGVHRLEQEARTASALNHPNIVTVHELGRAGSSHFIAQEYVEGMTLRDLLHAGPMPLDRILDITLQVACALQTAHAAGIIHRDIKPENIMIRSDGLVKVLDFGLAKFLAPAIPQLQTSAGMILGTLQYMSPEQARAIDVDARTDLWSLGVVLYEMIADKRPFDAPSASSAIARILQDDPPALDGIASPEMQRLLRRTLAKDREQRYASAEHLAADLRAIRDGTPALARSSRRRFLWVAAAAAPLLVVAAWLYVPRPPVRAAAVAGPIDSVAVLPFVNDTGSTALEYVSDGLTDTLTNAFSGIESFRVVPRASVFYYKGRAVDPLTVARELGVRAILTGRVTKSGDGALAIQTELIDSAKGSQIWGERFTAAASDALALQQRIARSVLDRLAVRAASPAGGTTDEQAFDLYLRARHAAAERKAESLGVARTLFRQATEKDPVFAAAYRGLADAYMLSAEYAGVPWEDVHDLAVSALEKAIALDPSSAEGHAYLGRLHAFEWEWTEAQNEYDRALRLDPGYSSTYIYYGNLMRRFEKAGKALDFYRRGLQLDPMSRILLSNVVETHIAAGDLPAARSEALKLIRLDSAGSGRRHLAHILALEGKREEALANLDQLMRVGDRTPGQISLIGATYAIAGEREKALAIAHDLEARFEARSAPAVVVAEVYAGLGDREKVFEWLGKDTSKGPRMSLMPGRIYFRSVRDDPRWDALMRRMGIRDHQR